MYASGVHRMSMRKSSLSIHGCFKLLLIHIGHHTIIGEVCNFIGYSHLVFYLIYLTFDKRYLSTSTHGEAKVRYGAVRVVSQLCEQKSSGNMWLEWLDGVWSKAPHTWISHWPHKVHTHTHTPAFATTLVLSNVARNINSYFADAFPCMLVRLFRYQKHVCDNIAGCERQKKEWPEWDHTLLAFLKRNRREIINLWSSVYARRPYAASSSIGTDIFCW